VAAEDERRPSRRDATRSSGPEAPGPVDRLDARRLPGEEAGEDDDAAGASAVRHLRGEALQRRGENVRGDEVEARADASAGCGSPPPSRSGCARTARSRGCWRAPSRSRPGRCRRPRPGAARAGTPAIASTPVPPPISAMRRMSRRDRRASRSSAIRQARVVAWWPVPKASAASISRAMRFGAMRARSWLPKTVIRPASTGVRPARTWASQSRVPTGRRRRSGAPCARARIRSGRIGAAVEIGRDLPEPAAVVAVVDADDGRGRVERLESGGEPGCGRPALERGRTHETGSSAPPRGPSRHTRSRPLPSRRRGQEPQAAVPRASGGGADRAGHAGAADAAIAAGVLGEVLLVVVLGVVEGRRFADLGRDGAVAGGAASRRLVGVARLASAAAACASSKT
jgi:hypothetical protein